MLENLKWMSGVGGNSYGSSSILDDYQDFKLGTAGIFGAASSSQPSQSGRTQ